MRFDDVVLGESYAWDRGRPTMHEPFRFVPESAGYVRSKGRRVRGFWGTMYDRYGVYGERDGVPARELRCTWVEHLEAEKRKQDEYAASRVAAEARERDRLAVSQWLVGLARRELDDGVSVRVSARHLSRWMDDDSVTAVAVALRGREADR